MKPRILLTGQNGQVGGDLLSFLPSVGEVIAFDRQRLDLSSAPDIRRTIREIRPQVIVNAAAYTAVDKAESEASTVQIINADAPLVMAEEAKAIGAALVHYSTDYVFDGEKRMPYEEGDTPNPLSVYGRAKLAGEQAVRESGVPHLIFRTAWVYTTRGRNFLLTILRLASEREELRIVNDQVGAPTLSREIARGTSSILATLFAGRNADAAFARVAGTYHMTAGGITTWYDFARAILDQASSAPPNIAWLASAMQGRSLVTKHLLPITTDQYPTPARRPRFSILSNALLNRTFGVQLPEWSEQLRSIFSKE
jgi:dTDP-4-dehydrorhamnose reductase